MTELDRQHTPLPGILLVGFDRLSRSPTALLAVGLGLNAVFQPYLGIYHDAMLYSGQVMTHVDPDTLDGDLFFRGGSQDQYSAFSTFAAPLAGLLGLQTAFFLIYLLSNGLLFAAVRRLFFRILPPSAAVLSFLYVAVVPVTFGPFDIFHLNEAFTSPRILSVACSLLALDRSLDRRWLGAVLLAVTGMSFHPLMAFPALLLILGQMAWTWLGGRGFAAVFLVAVAGLAALLATPAVAGKVLGTMSDEWKAGVIRFTWYHVPSCWSAAGFVLIGASVAVVLLARPGASDPSTRRLGVLLVLAAVGGVILAEAAARLPYRLLFQGQAYRFAWPLQLAAVPAGWAIAVHLWGRGVESSRAAAAVVATGLLCYRVRDFGMLEYLPLIALPAALAFRGFGRTPRVSGWAWKAVAVAAALYFGLCTAARLRASVHQWDLFVQEYDVLFLLQYLLPFTAGPLGFTAAIALLAWVSGRWAPRAAAGLAAALWLLASPITFAAGQTPWYSARHPDVADAEFFRNAVGWDGSRKPLAVYWPRKSLDFVWLRLECESYFSVYQMSGGMFSETTEQLGRARVARVGTFEMAFGFGTKPPDPHQKRYIEALLGAPYGTETPGLQSLLTACGDPELDYIVLPHEYPGFVHASDGKWFIYDCRRLREGAAPHYQDQERP